MSINSDYFLTSKRLGFRTWCKDDLDIAYGLWGDFEVTKLFDGRGPLSREQVKHRLHHEIATQSEHGVQYWPIFLLKSGDHIGCAGLRPYDAARNILEIGFHIRSNYWRKGYASESAVAVMDYAFKSLKVDGLFAGHNPKNLGSRNLLTKLGFNYTHDEFYEPTGLEHPSYLLKAEEYENIIGILGKHKTIKFT
jgi:RimJ/RimL family protein N-acetyltransferase